jgi:uncharacterized membrane protein YcaP (DUF421 family)
MKKEEIHLGDWKRLLIGQAPWEFMLEVAIRSLIMYLIFFIVMRLLGKRMSAQLTIFELIIVIVLGAAISLPMSSPDRGILPGIIILLFILAFEKGLTYLTFKSSKTEFITLGKLDVLIKDGRLLHETMNKTVLSRERIFAELRQEEITHLGEVERLYLETCGIFSIMKFKEERPGLSILPEWDNGLTDGKLSDKVLVCYNCGNLKSDNSKGHDACSACNNMRWVNAVKPC